MFSYSCVAVTPHNTLCGLPTSVLDGQRRYCTDDHHRAKRNDIAYQQRIATWRKNSPEVLVAKRAYDSALEAVRVARKAVARKAVAPQVADLQKTVNNAARNYLNLVELSRERQYPGILKAERAALLEDRRKRNAERKAEQQAEKERKENEDAYENQKYYSEFLDSYKKSLKRMKTEYDDELEIVRYRSESRIRRATERYETARSSWLKDHRAWLQYSLFDEPRSESSDNGTLEIPPDQDDIETQKERNEAFAAHMATHVAMRALEEEDAALTDEARIAAAEAETEAHQMPYCMALLNLFNAIQVSQRKGMSLSCALEGEWTLICIRNMFWDRLRAAMHRLEMAYWQHIKTQLENAPERVIHNLIEHYVWDGPILFLHAENTVFEVAPVFARDPEGGIDLRAFAADSQNVHRSGVISAVEAAIHRLCDIPCASDQNTLTEISPIVNTKAPELLAVITDDYNLVSAFNYSYATVLDHAWGVIRSHADREALESRFIDEVRDGEDVCHTGKMTRLVNVLAGFHDAVGDLMSPMELFRNRFTLLSKKPLDERESAAKDLFEEFHIVEEEQDAWLESLMEA